MVAPAFPVEERLRKALRENLLPAPRHDWSLDDAGLTAHQLVELFESQVLSRQLDLHSRRLQAKKQTFYTIGSAGHEGNAAIAAALRVTDPAFLHYRDAAFFIQRSKQLPGQTPAWDLLLSFAASADDPISGGRHKVLGSRALSIPPQTSTIASQLPKAVGAAYSIGLNRRLGLEGAWPADSVVACSFGDASVNHSTAQGAFNTACWTAYQGLPLPLLWVCEDNGIGISVPTPQGWIETAMSRRPALHYLACDGLDLLDTHRAAREAVGIARAQRKPVFLHMRCVRLMGHAGSDAEQGYLSAQQIEAAESRDPLLFGAALLREHAGMRAAQVLELYEATGARVAAVAQEAIKRPKLACAAEVMASIVPPARAARARASSEPVEAPGRPASKEPMARLLNQSLERLLAQYPHLVIAGEDVGRKGGVYGVTQRLQAKYGPHRVMDTLLDEQSILGLGIGLAHNGLLPIVEIQFLAYLHNAEDQLRGEASTLSFFSKGQFTNPMVVRIAGLGYQKGFGGHFHNDNAIAVLRDIPGLLVACPSNGADAVGLLQEAVRLADEEQRVVVFLEPIALYHTRDLHAPDDGLWSFADPGPGHRIAHRELGVWGTGRDLAIVTYGNGVHLGRQAAAELEKQGVSLRIVDLRWLTDIDHERVQAAVRDCARVLIVDECRRSGSLSEELMAELCARGWTAERMRRLTAQDSFIPLGVAATCTLPSRESIVAEALALTRPPMTRQRIVVVCPGRGTYNQAEWGYLSKYHGDQAALLADFDAYRAQRGQPTLTALDRDIPFQLALHSRGDHASPLIYACAYLDALAIDPERYEIVAVTGNSMGWYIALAVAQSLAPRDALHLIDTMGTLMQQSLIGGQLLVPWVGEDWRGQPAARTAMLALAADVTARGPGVAYLSIDLGGMLVFGGDEAGLEALGKLLPKQERYPMRLFNHAAFHTPLQQPVRARARQELGADPFQRPRIPLVDGRGHVWTPHSTGPQALWDYTLGHQLTEPYDFTRALSVAVREFAPDRLIILGPGSTLGGAVAQTLIQLDWQGLQDKGGFQARQQQDPVVLAMGIEAQRAVALARP